MKKLLSLALLIGSTASYAAIDRHVVLRDGEADIVDYDSNTGNSIMFTPNGAVMAHTDRITGDTIVFD